MTDPISVEDFLATAAPRTDKVRVCARNDLVERHLQLNVEYADALRDARPSGLASEDIDTTAAEAIADQILAVEAEMESSVMEVHMRSIGAQAWADLLRLHAPKKEHRGYAHDPDTFPPAAVAACATSPVITEVQAAQMFTDLASGEWTKLWVCAVGLNETPTPRPKSQAAADLLQARRPSAVSPENVGSLAEPSSDGSGAQ